MLDLLSMSIPAFHAERTIRVYLPRDYYHSSKRYPVLYMHDGKNVFCDEDAIGGVSLDLERYLDNRKADLIVIGIDANPSHEGRIDEYCPWVNGEYSEKFIGYRQSTGGKGKHYADFVVHQLKPEIDARYRTISERNYIGGISLGGLISTFTVCRYPSVFSRVAAVSSGFYRNQEEIESLLRGSRLSSIDRFYLDCGTAEGKGDPVASKEFVRSNQAIYEILKDKVRNVNFQVLAGVEHNYKEFRNRVPEILSYLLS